MSNPRSDLPPAIVLAFVPRPDAAARLRRALAIILEAAERSVPAPVAGTDPSVSGDQVPREENR